MFFKTRYNQGAQPQNSLAQRKPHELGDLTKNTTKELKIAA